MEYAKEKGLKEGREIGKKEGIKEGIKEGSYKRNIEIAKKLKKLRTISETEIADVTGLSIEVINSL